MRALNKKPRGDSKLDALTPEQQTQLAEWLTIDNLTYADARERVAKEFGLATSVSALSSFYSSFAAPWKYARAKGDADNFASLMEGKFDAASIKRAKQLAFEAMTSPRPDLKVARALLKIVGDSAKVDIAKEKLALDSRRIAILEKKAALADKATSIEKDQSLTEEEKARKMRALFRL